MAEHHPAEPVEILVTGSFPTARPLDEMFRCHRVGRDGDFETILATAGSRIRGLAVAGHRIIDGAVLDRLPAAEIVANFGVGYDHIDAHAAAERGVVVTNTPDVLTEEVADLALALTLATLREIPAADRYVRAGEWRRAPFPLGASLRGRRIGIAGMGRIGAAIARRFEACAVPVAYWSRRPRPEAPWRYVATLRDLAAEVDVLVMAVPGGASTQGIVGAEVLDALGPNGVLVNIARGSVVDEAALVAALTEGRILAAGLDVFAHEPEVPAALVALPNTVLLPHIGSATHHTRTAMGDLVVDNLAAWFAGGLPPTPVPETPVTARG